MVLHVSFLSLPCVAHCWVEAMLDVEFLQFLLGLYKMDF